MDLNFEIWAVDHENHKRALIGTCFMLGLAKVWAEDASLLNDIEVVSKTTDQRWYYKRKEPRE